MQRRVTIAIGGSAHNSRRPGNRLARPPALLAVTALVLHGCAIHHRGPVLLPVWELATAEPQQVLRIARTRVDVDQELPARVAQRLSDEFTLICIRETADWAELRRQLQLPPPPPGVDLSRGSIVGILAQVGEAAQPQWPILLQTVRTRSGLGWIDASFVPGVYYPIRTAGYLELVYVPDLQTIGMVQINNRSFMFPTGAAFH
jgi:hypothetical protein